MTFYIDFRGWCEIEADSRELAESKFWDIVSDYIPHSEVEIEGVEEKDED